ncbi:MAG: IS1096 element passenger TnpR family protein [Planctomycetota bacterium]
MAKKKSRTRKALDTTLPIYQVKITLQYIKPPIWRRVQTNDCSLDELHDIIQVCMGWEDEHMHAFVIEGEEFGNPKRGSQAEYDSRFVRLSEVVDEGHTRFRYDYDFGDDWRHIIDVEKTLAAEEGVRYPRCVKGERACPPEDSGGPHGYPYFLEKIQDPEHEEHEEALEWVGGEFDPEELDLDEMNEELRRLRRWLGKRKGKHALQAAFGKGDLVRVKPGIVHDQYPDIPLGGWVGKVKRIGWLTPIGYAVHWTKPTLDQAHPVLFDRCQRDEIKPYKYWLDENQLEAAAEETPVAMEQPTNLVTRPLSMDDPDDRIRMVFGLTSDYPLPPATQKTQRQYLDYLKSHLSFPIKADYAAASVLGSDTSEEITVLGFSSRSALDPKDGVFCQGRKRQHFFDVPLSAIHVNDDEPNFQYVEDYTYWLWEVQQYDEEDDAVKSPQVPIGTIAYYGPDDRTTTKIVAGVIKEEGAEPIIKRWVATDVTTDPKVQKEIDRFFNKHGVKRVGMSDGNMGCPHEEGEDFPAGGDCPFCPYWKGKQGSGAKE